MMKNIKITKIAVFIVTLMLIIIIMPVSLIAWPFYKCAELFCQFGDRYGYNKLLTAIVLIITGIPMLLAMPFYILAEYYINVCDRHGYGKDFYELLGIKNKIISSDYSRYNKRS